MSSRAAEVVQDVARWTSFVGLALLVGALWFVAWCWPAGWRRAGWRRLAVTGWAVLGASSAALLLTYGPAAAGSRLADPRVIGQGLGSRTGYALLARLVVLAVVGAGLVWNRVLRSRVAPGLVLASAFGLAVTWSAVSHSDSSSHPGVLVVLDVLHVVAMAVWLGGLATLGLVLLRNADAVGARDAVGRFSSTAMVCVAVLGGTGAVQAWGQVGSVAALSGNAYARLLLGKVALAVVLLGLAALARSRVRGRQAADRWRLRRIVLTEASVGLAVLAVTAALVTTKPARETHTRAVAQSRLAATSARQATQRTPALAGRVPYDAGIGRAGRGVVEVSVTSARVGPSELHLTVLDVDGAPRDLTGIRAALRRNATGATPSPIVLDALGKGHCRGEVAFASPGTWQVGLLVMLPGGAQAAVVADVSVS